MPFVLQVLVTAAALWVATRLVPGITFHGSALAFLGVALVFGVVNAVVRPILTLISFPLVILSLGLFLLVINGLMLWLSSSLSQSLGLGFRVSGFGAAFVGALVVSVVSTVLAWLIG
jgi:putative membrane protein